MRDKKNIVLTGMRGVGKTKLGKILAKKLNRKFIDLDHEIIKRIKKTINEIVKEKGWEYFRELEYKECQRVSFLENTVIATGGGTFMYERNVPLLKERGIIILLTSPISDLKKRIKNEEKRPSLSRKKSSIDEIEEIWKTRKNQYFAVADFVFDTNDKVNLESLSEIIIKKMKFF